MAREWTDCPDCGTSLKSTNLSRHLKRKHGWGSEEIKEAEAALSRQPRPNLVPRILAFLIVVVVAIAIAMVAIPSPGNQGPPRTVAVIETNMGTIEVLLYVEEAPNTTAHFIQLAQETFYDGLTFHRAIEGFIIQGGGHDSELRLKPSPYEDIPLEISANLSNVRATVAMAHKPGEPDSANTQFFINLADNTHLDPGVDPSGFAVFGRVIFGMNVADAIGEVETQTIANFDYVPVSAVVILSITIDVR